MKPGPLFNMNAFSNPDGVEAGGGHGTMIRLLRQLASHD
jgi:hypothetical protein